MMVEQWWLEHSMQEEPDVLMMRAIVRGERAALEQLYACHGPAILSYLVGMLGDRVLAEEVLQDTMLAAWKGAATFRGESKVRTWLLAIARYRALNARRRQAVTQIELGEGAAEQGSGPVEALERETQARAVREALQQLPDEQRETLEMIFYHELSGPEAAELLGVAAGTVKSRLHRAKSALRRLLPGGEATNG